MYASAMKWREGRASAIKGMVMPMVKRMGTCRASGIRGYRGETKQLKFLGNDVRRQAQWDIFIQLGCTGAIDRVLYISPERYSPPVERQAGELFSNFIPLRYNLPL